MALVVGVSGMVPAAATIRPDTGCRNGPVSITFDDGPSPVHTPRLLRVLRANHAQATFFVQGQNAKRWPKLLKHMVADGHTVENHSWDHPVLTDLSAAQIRREISRTSTVITTTTGVAPRYLRPPFGASDRRVARIASRLGLAEELWTIDTNDWRRKSAKNIHNAALRGLRPHRHNVILMHDALGNSARTINAVPAIIKDLRDWGYCLVPLQVAGPLSRISARNVSIDEGTSATTKTTVTFALNAPSQRDASLRVYTADGTAVAGTDYTAIDKILTIKRGATSVSTVISIIADPKPSPNRTFSLMLDHATDVKIGTPKVTITVTDNRAWAEGRDALIAPQ